jgi:hypothetical protein
MHIGDVDVTVDVDLASFGTSMTVASPPNQAVLPRDVLDMAHDLQRSPAA